MLTSEELKSQAQSLQDLMNRCRLRDQNSSEVGSKSATPEWETDRAHLIAEFPQPEPANRLESQQQIILDEEFES